MTIGIGAGPDCDGQVLVFHDLTGYGERKPPKMAKQYVNVFPQLTQAVAEYVKDVRGKLFSASPRNTDSPWTPRWSRRFIYKPKDGPSCASRLWDRGRWAPFGPRACFRPGPR